MPPQPPQPTYVDIIGPMDKGVNSGIAPNLLKKNQLFSGNNITVRGDFVSPRNPVQKLTVNYQTGKDVSTGIFQGACFYQPDVGNASLMASISGRLFQFSINGSLLTATERTIPSDLNITNASQCWMWQSENYVICNDGTHLPIFFDGNVSRRSFSQTPPLLQPVSSNFVIPPIGSTVAVTFATPYTGPLNITVLVDDALYEIVPTTGSYSAVLTNLSAVAGTTVTAGSIIQSEGTVWGSLLSDFSIPLPTYSAGGPNGIYQVSNYVVGFVWTMNVSAPSAKVGDLITIPLQPVAARVVSVVGHSVGITFDNSVAVQFANNGLNQGPIIEFIPITTATFMKAGDQIDYASNNQPNVTVGSVLEDFVNPAQGTIVTVLLSQPYTGTPGAIVYIGTGQYAITAGPPVPTSNTIVLKNIDDAIGTNGVVNLRGPNTVIFPNVLIGPGQLSIVPELPIGRMGAYGMGRNWMCLADGRSFIAGDIVGGSAGTDSLNFRDAVLKVTENSYLFEGGVFVVPGSVTGNIRAMCFAATLDASLGQGALQVFTSNTVFSCNAPVDRTTWQNLTNPILTESLISNGALGQNSTMPANGDILFRAPDGDRSLILGRREFNTWGNVPQSREVQPTINSDNTALLNYSSRVIFNNRSLLTAGPKSSPNGVYHTTLIAINFDPLSALNVKQPSVYDGLWTPFNTLQLITGVVNGVTRCFAFVLNINVTPNKIEVWEILDDTTILTQDNGKNPIVQDFSTGDLFTSDCSSGNKSEYDFCRLMDGEMGVDEVVGSVQFQVYYRPDHNPNWQLWKQWTVGGLSTFYPRMGFGTPTNVLCDPNLNRPMNDAFTFQVRFVITGSCRFLKARVKANALPQPEFAPPICDSTP